jgi:hypothetical protein
MDKAKAVLLDDYMRTGDLGILVKAYADLKAARQVLNKESTHSGYGYFDCGCQGAKSCCLPYDTWNAVHNKGAGGR